MANWQLALDLRGGSEQPIFIRLARAISDDVRRGRLKPGDELPGSRSLARALGVHRNTVLAAYAELTAEGWITTEKAARTFVSYALPDVEPGQRGRRARPASVGFDVEVPALVDGHGSLVERGRDLGGVPTRDSAAAAGRAPKVVAMS